MTKYIPKPVILEAVEFTTTGAALEFLNAGEYVVVEKEAIVLCQPDGTLMRVEVGDIYLVRYADGTIYPAEKKAFEDAYIELSGVVSLDFTALRHDDGWELVCEACGPFAHTEHEEDWANMTQSHIREKHS